MQTSGVKEKGTFTTRKPLVLASASPRRRDFLAGLGLDFTICPPRIDEGKRAGEGPEDFVRRLAMEKAEAVAGQTGAWVLAADTIVVIDDEILGKPSSVPEAESMLQLLSGRWHQVWTAFAICQQDDGTRVLQAVCTRVRFRSLSPELYRSYVASGEPMDKAGAYGIQGQGSFLVEEVQGSYTNVVGLPVARVVQELLGLGIIRPAMDK